MLVGLEVGRVRVRSGPSPKETEECVFVCFAESLSPRLRERKEDFWGVVWVVWSRREGVVEVRDTAGDEASLLGDVVRFIIAERGPRGTKERRFRVLRDVVVVQSLLASVKVTCIAVFVPPCPISIRRGRCRCGRAEWNKGLSLRAKRPALLSPSAGPRPYLFVCPLSALAVPRMKRWLVRGLVVACLVRPLFQDGLGALISQSAHTSDSSPYLWLISISPKANGPDLPPLSSTLKQ